MKEFTFNPCPLCGCAVKTNFGMSMIGGQNLHISCVACGVALSKVCFNTEDIREAKNMWNKRSEIDKTKIIVMRLK